VYPLLRVFEGFAAHGWLLYPNATSHWATALMSDIFYRLLKGSVLISPDRNVANPTSAQVLSMAQQFHLSVLTRLSIGTQFWVFTYALVVCFVLVCT